CGAILERAGGVGAFELEKEPTGTAVDARHLDEGRVADEVEDRGHDRSIAADALLAMRAPLIGARFRSGMLATLRPAARGLARRRSHRPRAAASGAEQNLLGLIHLDRQKMGAATIGMDQLHQASVRLDDLRVLRIAPETEDFERLLLRHGL